MLGVRVLFKNQRQPQTFIFSRHRWKHISPPAEFGGNTVFCVVEPWLSPAGTFSPPPAAQVVSMCKMCPEAAGEPADTPWASDTHLLTHTHYDPSHTPCLLTHRVTPSLTVLPYQHTLTHTHTFSLLSHNKSSVQILSPSLWRNCKTFWTEFDFSAG